MPLVVRLITLVIIAAAGFALPMTCAQGRTAAAAKPIAIEIPASQSLDPPALALSARTAQHVATHSLAGRTFDAAPLDCGKTAPRVSDHSATFDTQPFAPGYLTTDLLPAEDRADAFAPPTTLIPLESRAGPPDAPPPRSID